MTERVATALVGILLVMGCEVITDDFDRVIAIQIDGAASREIQTGDSLQLVATAINAAGETVPEAEVTWALLDVDSGQVGFTLEPSGLVIGVSEGEGRVRARVENLQSDPITITVLPADTTSSPIQERTRTSTAARTPATARASDGS